MAKDDDKGKKTPKNNELSDAARQLGSAGGRIGGPARDRALSHEEKVKIAREGGLASAAHRKAEKTKLHRKLKKGKGGK